MAFSSSNVKFQRKVSIQNSTKVTRGGFQIFDPAAPGSTDGSDGAVLIATGTSGDYYTLKRGAAAGTAANYQRGIFRFSGKVTVAAGSTSGTLTVPAGLDVTVDMILSGYCGSATTVSALTAPLITISGTTLTVTVTDPGGATTATIWVAIP